MEIEEINIDEILTNNKDNIELLNTFSKDYFSININDKIINSIKKMDEMIVEEDKKTDVLNILESKINAIELEATLNQYTQYKQILTEKYIQYASIIVANNKKIEMISNVIKDNKEIVNNIYSIIGILDNNIDSITKKIEQYNPISPPSSNGNTTPKEELEKQVDNVEQYQSNDIIEGSIQ
jgi:hypothetical protein